MKLKNILIALAVILGFQTVKAQLPKTQMSAGVSIDAFTYKGDLDDDKIFNSTKPGFGFFWMLYFNPHMAIRLSYNQGWAGASDEDSKNISRRNRGLSFKTHISEFSSVVTYDFFVTHRRYKYRPFFTPYVFAGVAVYNFNPKADYNGKTYNLHDIGTEGQLLVNVDGVPKQYSLTQVNIPFGMGLKFKLAEKLDVRFEVGVRKLFTDYLDDVSDRYADPKQMLAQMGEIGQIADRSIYVKNGSSGYAANEIRGNKKNKDWYFVTALSLSYILDRGERCPKFK